MGRLEANSNIDPYFNDVSLLLPFDSNFNDFSKNNFSVTVNGNAQISTTQSKFGGSSAYFDGNSVIESPTNNSTLSLGDGDFTIEFWAYPTSTSFQYSQFVSWRGPAGAGDSEDHGSFSFDSYNNKVIWYTNTFVVQSSNNSVPFNFWTHVVLVRNGTNLKIYINGNEDGSTDISTQSYEYSTYGVTVGALKDRSGPDNGEAYSGYIDDLRITKGVARYTSNFTPPSKLPLNINNRISIKKQNQSTLKPYRITDSGVTNSENIYIFKGGSANTISTVFDSSELKSTNSVSSSDKIGIFNPNTLAQTTYFYRSGHGWRTNVNITTDVSNNEILLNSLIVIYLNDDIYKEISVGSGAIIQRSNSGKLNLNSSNIPLNTLNIRVTNGPNNAPWGVGGSGPCGNDFQLITNPNGNYWGQGHLSCDFFIAWDNQYGNLPYKWRMYYDSDGRLDYAFHPTATQEALPSKGWSNGMTISIV